jgi:enoyl-CoA hydratase
MSEDIVTYKIDGKVGIVSLNRPAKLNAITKEIRLAAVDALTRADDDPDTHVVLLRAEGRSFCAGYDLGGGDPDKESWRHNPLKWHTYLNGSLELELLPWYMRKPVIAAVQGHAVGGGCELAMLCDITIAADDAKFGEPEIRFSATGPAFVMPWIIGHKRARELLYLGDLIDATTALEFGMVNRVVPAAALQDYALAYAHRMAHVSPEALNATKLALSRGADAAGFRNALQAGLDVIAPLYAANTEFGDAFRAKVASEGLGAALKWRKSHFDK